MFVDHLKGNKPETLSLEVAFGRHVIAGDLAKSTVVGFSPGHVVIIQQILGEAFGKGWAGPEGVWFRGANRPAAKYKFYPGIMSPGNSDSTQGIDTEFPKDTPHSNTAWLRLECPSGGETGIPDADTKNNPPTGHTGIYGCQLGDIYEDSGNVTSSGVLLTNPADIIAFGCIEIRRYPTSRINWASLHTLRQQCNTLEARDYTTLPQGVGLTGLYYDGSSFNTLKSQRVDPIVEFPTSQGAPALGLNVDSFSVRWEGKVRPRYTQTYTFYLTHDAGGKLWINGTLIIDQWGTIGTHSATVSMNADQFYDIKIEWNETAGDAQIKLEWESSSQAREVVPQDRLYPKNDSRKRFECHVAFTQRTNFDSFLRQVLFSCNGGFQDADGQLTFFCLDFVEPSFSFNESNIVTDTFQFYPRFTQQELLALPNRFLADGRDLDSQYLEKFDPEVFYELPELQALAGRINEETVFVGNTTRWQALKNLAHYARIRTAPMVCEFEGLPVTFPVLPGDLTTVTHSNANWNEKPFLCLEATDKSIDAAADERIFKLLSWHVE